MAVTRQIWGVSRPIEYIAIGCHVWQTSHDGKLNKCIAICGDASSAEALAIELAIIEYVRARYRAH